MRTAGIPSGSHFDAILSTHGMRNKPNNLFVLSLEFPAGFSICSIWNYFSLKFKMPGRAPFFICYRLLLTSNDRGTAPIRRPLRRLIIFQIMAINSQNGEENYKT